MNERLTIITGGQTGVDRGALRGAIDAGFAVGGYMPKNGCDEDGPIPAEIAKHLVRCPLPGYSARTATNLDMAEALLIIVVDAEDPLATPGTRMTWEGAQLRKIPRMVVDPASAVEPFVNLLFHWARRKSVTKLMVAGPRASKWTNGEYEAAAFLRKLGVLLALKKDQIDVAHRNPASR